MYIHNKDIDVDGCVCVLCNVNVSVGVCVSVCPYTTRRSWRSLTKRCPLPPWCEPPPRLAGLGLAPRLAGLGLAPLGLAPLRVALRVMVVGVVAPGHALHRQTAQAVPIAFRADHTLQAEGAPLGHHLDPVDLHPAPS